MKSKLFLFLSILTGIYLIYGLYTVGTNLNSYRTIDLTIVVVTLLVIGSLEFFFIRSYRKYAKPEYKQRELNLKASNEYARKEAAEKAAKEKFEQEKNIPGSKSRMQFLEADLCIKLRHMAGLPVSEGAEIYLYRCKDKVIFERNRDAFELKASSMKDILLKTDVEIQKSYVSSVGGAVGGYVLFGPLGAMVGGRAKEKKSKTEEKYLIFDYLNKDGAQDFISFEATNEPQAILFNTNHYDLTKNERTTTTL